MPLFPIAPTPSFSTVSTSVATTVKSAHGCCVCCGIDLTYAPSAGRVTKANHLSANAWFCAECEPYLFVMLPLVKELRAKSEADMQARAKAMF